MPWRTILIDEQQEEKQLLLALFALALAIRLVFVIPAAGMLLGGDAGYYDEVAQNVLAGKGHIAHNVMGADRQSLMPPLYPAFLAVVYFCLGHNWLAVQLIQVVLGAVTCVLIYLIARHLTNQRVGWIASLIAVGYPTLVLFTREVLTETLFLFFLVAWMWFMVSRGRELLSFRNQALSGIMQGIMTLTRAVTFFLPWFVLLWQWKRFKGARKAAFLSSMAMILFFALTLAPWTIRSYRVHNAFIPVASEGYEMLWIFKVKLEGLIPPTDYKYLPPSWYELPEAERGQLALRETLRVFKEQPLKFIKNSFVGSFAIFRPFTPTTDYNSGLGILLPLVPFQVGFDKLSSCGKLRANLPVQEESDAQENLHRRLNRRRTCILAGFHQERREISA